MSSVEVSVLGLPSPTLVSPQFSRWLPSIVTGFDCDSFCSGNVWVRTTAEDRFTSEGAGDWNSKWNFEEDGVWVILKILQKYRTVIEI